MSEEISMFAPGTLDASGGVIVETAAWNLTLLSSWRLAAWVITQAGWFPGAAVTDPALFRFGAGNWESDAIVLPLAGGPTFLDLWIPLPPTWDGQLRWIPGGEAYGFGVYAAGNWVSAVDVSVWVQLRAKLPRERCA